MSSIRPHLGPDAQRLSGGDTATVWRVGDRVVKTGSGPPTLWAAEARALSTLAAHGVPTAQVLDVADDGIVLAWEPPGAPDPAALGHVIAAMHTLSGEVFGEDAPTWIGAVPFAPGATKDARTWLVDHRIAPLVARTRSQLGTDLADRVLESAATAPLVDPVPRLVHGDLWSGNVLHTARGPVLIDPSCSWGHRGVDLAMMQWLGGFSPRCMAAYRSHLPTDDALWATLPLFRLIPLLVHVAMFGAGYVPGVRDALAELGAR